METVGGTPEVGHETRVRVAGETLARHDLTPEVVQVRLRQTTFQEGAAP